MSDPTLLSLLRYAGVPKGFLNWLIAYGAPAVVESARLHRTLLGEPADWSERAEAAFRNLPITSDDDLLAEFLALEALPDWLMGYLTSNLELIGAQLRHYHEPALVVTPAIDPADLERLSDDDDALIRMAVARHPATPVTLLQRLEFDDSTLVRRAVALNPHTPAESLHRLMIDGLHTRLAVAKHPNLAEPTMLRLADDPYMPIRQAVLQHPSATAAVRERLLLNLLEICVTSNEPLYQLLGLAHPQTPPRYLEAGARSIHWRSRYGLAQNPSTPPAALAELTHDGNVFVRAAAQQASARS